jgi:hypothetical protein
MKYYVKDTTRKANNKTPVIIKDSVPEMVQYLESVCQRQFNQTRFEFMNHCESVGAGSDEPTGQCFTELMSEYVEVGAVKDTPNGPVPIRCNIFETARFNKFKNECGD